jgi:hypothetical protein
MTKLATSADRNTFQRDSYVRRCQEQGKEPREDYLKMYDNWNKQAQEKEADPEWAKHNMEYDLRTCDWIIEKVRAREEYAQNLYAAMCNRDFQKKDVWPILKNQTWSCSWRYAGGIVAHLRGEGDYIDWYCSGIRGAGLTDKDRADMSAELIARCEWMDQHFVGEGHVTDEIQADLRQLGWSVLDDEVDE